MRYTIPSISTVHLFASAAAAVLLQNALLAQHDPAESVDLQAPLREAIVQDGEQKWVRIRVVDGITGRPVENAELLLIAESDTPVGGELEPAMRFDGDEDGFVVARVDEAADGYRPWAWLCVRAPGYGQRMSMRTLESPVVRLSPGTALPVQVRDWRDQPVSGALVGFCSGCGHTPDLVHGTTGADGMVTLPDVDVHNGIADCYVVHPELHFHYDCPRYRPGRLPALLRVAPADVHAGVVVDAQGAPVAGAFVGQSDVHRGPWARTRADGTFVLCGHEGPVDPWVHVDGRRFLFEAGSDRTNLWLQLPASVDGEDDVVQIDLTEAQRARREARIEREQQLAEARERRWPRVPVRTVGLPKDGTVLLRTRRRTWELGTQIELGEPVPLPDEEFVFVLQAEGDERIVPGDRQQAVRDGAVRLHWYRPTRLEGRVVDGDGRPVVVDAALVEPGYIEPHATIGTVRFDGGLALPCTAVGPNWLLLEDPYGRSRRIVEVDLPERGDDAFLDIGTVVLPFEPAHTFVRADGTPLVDGEVRLLRAGWHDIENGFVFELDDRGDVWLPPLRTGDALLVRSQWPPAADAEGASVVDLPSRFVVGETVPAQFRMHGGELRLEVDADGAGAFATIGDRVVPLRGPTVVRGLPTGVCRVVLAAEGRRSAVVEVEVAVPGDGAPRRWLRAALPAVR